MSLDGFELADWDDHGPTMYRLGDDNAPEEVAFDLTLYVQLIEGGVWEASVLIGPCGSRYWENPMDGFVVELGTCDTAEEAAALGREELAHHTSHVAALWR